LPYAGLKPESFINPWLHILKPDFSFNSMLKLNIVC